MLRNVDAIPAVLLIDGHNPLTLLHDLLSEGIHELDDDEFGWDSDKPNVQFNQLVVTQEQLEQIRALRDS